MQALMFPENCIGIL